MNSSINTAPSGQAKASENIISSKGKYEREGRSDSNEADSSDNVNSFQASIQKVSETSKNKIDTADSPEKSEKSEKPEKDNSGNNLPVSNDFAELPAQMPVQSERSLLPQMGVGNKIPGDDEATALSSQLNQLLNKLDGTSKGKAEIAAGSAAKTATSVISSAVLADNDSVEVAVEAQTDNIKNNLKNISNQPPGGLPSNTAALETTAKANGTLNTGLKAESTSNLTTEATIKDSGENSQIVSKAISQQQILQNMQNSTLLQTASTPASASGNPAIDSLPVLTNTTVNSFSASNLQSMPQAEIAQAFARPGWSQAMGKQVLMMINQNIGTAEIKLNPAHLGPIEMLIDMSDEQVSVSMSSRHAVVRDAMEQALPKLREMLEENGLTLADTDISKQSFAEQREQNEENNRKDSIVTDADLSATSELSSTLIEQNVGQLGVVDYYI